MFGRSPFQYVVSGFSRASPLLFALALCAMLASPVAIPDLHAAAQKTARLRAQQRPDIMKRQGLRRHEEPAYARGYAGGHAKGLADGRSQERYDPVGSREYRSAEEGYQASYGSRDAYRNNYRAGFRQGYEDGYRDGTR
jgi:hypothetical protein